MSDPVSLPISCPACRRPVTLGFSVWTPAEPRHAQTWKCPHCHTQNQGQFSGKIEWVLPRQDNDPQPKAGASKTKYP